MSNVPRGSRREKNQNCIQHLLLTHSYCGGWWAWLGYSSAKIYMIWGGLTAFITAHLGPGWLVGHTVCFMISCWPLIRQYLVNLLQVMLAHICYPPYIIQPPHTPETQHLTPYHHQHFTLYEWISTKWSTYNFYNYSFLLVSILSPDFWANLLLVWLGGLPGLFACRPPVLSSLSSFIFYFAKTRNTYLGHNLYVVSDQTDCQNTHRIVERE